ncbi:hypothetical protein ACF0H5_004801 [Mactra antiquata]
MELNDLPNSPFLKLQTSAYVAVRDWSTESIYGLTGAMLAAIVSSVCLECMNEYLNYLKHKSFKNPNGPVCCGVPVVSLCEKLGQTIIYMLKVLFSYFALLCLMTMNIWLLVSLITGGFIGYGIGKPLIANQIKDTITTHGYDCIQLKLTHHGHLKNNRSQRSISWRYQPINRPDIVVNTRQFDDDVTFSENCADTSRTSNDIVWIRRSSDDVRMAASESSVFDDSELRSRTVEEFIRTPDSTNNFDSITSAERHSNRSVSRFKSTSKVINESFRSYKREREVDKCNTSVSASADVSFESSTLDMSDTQNEILKCSTNKVSRSTSTSSARFKPISKQINRQMSFHSDFD